MSSKIVFVNQATGYLTIDIINEFAKKFDELTLITGSIRVQNILLNKKVKIERIIKYNRGNTARKGFSWIIGTLQILYLMQFKYRQFEKFYFTIPPTAYLFAPWFKEKYSIAIYDLYPDALKIHNLSNDGLIFHWWAIRNRNVFEKAHCIFALSDNMKRRILSYSCSSVVKVIPNWTAFSGYTPVLKNQNAKIKRDGLTGMFIVQYSGNIGATHNVDTLIDVAAQLIDNADIEFIIIGRGDRTTAIGSLIKDRELKNCRLLPFGCDEELYELLCSADLAVVTIDGRTQDASVPSKLYNIMAAGVPVMGIAPLNSALSAIILENDMGRVFEMNNIEGMKEFILQIKNDGKFQSALAENALKASINYTSANAGLYLKNYIE